MNANAKPNPEDVIMSFGKYGGQTLGWIADHDLLYLDWLVGAQIRSDKLRQAVFEIAERRAHEIRSLLDSMDGDS